MITVVNWAFYQSETTGKNQQGTNQEPTEGVKPASGNGFDTPKNVKKEKNIETLTTFSSDAVEYRLSDLLFGKIREWKPNFMQEVDTDQKKDSLMQKWAVHIDRLSRLNKRTPEHIEKVITWCQADDFWRPNILSTQTLRKQIEKLEAQMAQGGTHGKNRGDFTAVGGIKPTPGKYDNL